MDRRVSKGGELVVIAGDTVECFCDVCCSFQDYFLEDKKGKR